MSSVLEFVASAVAGALLVAGYLFFIAFPGVRYLRVHAFLRGLRRELEPVAREVGATTRTEWVPEKEQIMYFFEFPNEKWVLDTRGAGDAPVSAWLTLAVGEGYFNVFVPQFTPAKDHSANYQALVGAVNRLRAHGHPDMPPSGAPLT